MSERSLRAGNAAILILIVIQYMFGVFVNRSIVLSGVASTRLQAILVVHIAFGTLLGIASILFLFFALRARNTKWKFPAVLGFAGIVGTGISAFRFVVTQQEPWPYFMLLFFALAFVSYLWSYLT